MPYTKAEIESIKGNLRKIQTYVKENYVPRLRKYDTLSVDFGELKHYPGRWEPEHEHSFWFNYNGEICYRCGGLGLHFIEENDGPISSVFQSLTYATDLLLSWQQVKRLIESELDKRDRERAALASFEV